jgi:hypothetical protein
MAIQADIYVRSVMAGEASDLNDSYIQRWPSADAEIIINSSAGYFEIMVITDFHPGRRDEVSRKSPCIEGRLPGGSIHLREEELNASRISKRIALIRNKWRLSSGICGVIWPG